MHSSFGFPVPTQGSGLLSDSRFLEVEAQFVCPVAGRVGVIRTSKVAAAAVAAPGACRKRSLRGPGRENPPVIRA